MRREGEMENEPSSKVWRSVGAAGRLLAFHLVATAAAFGQMDYRDPDEGRARLVALAESVPGAKVWEMEETSTPGVVSWVLRVSSKADDRGNFERNSVLFECGMHGREWLASEACLMFAEWLLENTRTREVEELLERVDVWIVPYTNPAGRYLDDAGAGDPTSYTRICIGGPTPGASCTASSQCGAGGSCTGGWRGNANVDACYAGVDLARNFSRGWIGSENPDCLGNDAHKYRGDQPFSEPESRTMRRLVHDMGFTTVVIVHAPTQRIWQMNASAHAGDSVVLDRVTGLSSQLSAADPEIAMPRLSVGNGLGQFSAWLSRESNVVGELDVGTHRGVNTFFMELPFSSSLVSYTGDDYSGAPYQATANDGSNVFHPSGTANATMLTETVLPLFKELVRETQVPQCPIAASGSLTADCSGKDFGLVGAKIASSQDEVGSLDVDPASREETLQPGTRAVVFAVQNMSAPDSDFTEVDVRLTVERSGALVEDQMFEVSAQYGERQVVTWPVDFEGGHDYRVTLEVQDSVSSNNVKSFAFRVLDWPSIDLLGHQHAIDLQFALDLLDGWIQLGAPGRAPAGLIDRWLATDEVMLELTLDALGGSSQQLEQGMRLRRFESRTGVTWYASRSGVSLIVRRGAADRNGMAALEVTVRLDERLIGRPRGDAFVSLRAPSGYLVAGRTRAAERRSAK